MSHEVETMAYVGKVPWHGLGTYLGEEDVTAEEMMEKAGLNWEVKKHPILAMVNSEMKLVPGQHALFRESTDFLSIVGKEFTPVQNHEAFDFLDALTGLGLKFHTAGSLFEGRKVWALARMPENVTIERVNGYQDEREVYAAFVLPHGMGAIWVFDTNVRIVCANTESWARQQAKGHAFKMAHRPNVRDRIEEAQAALQYTIKQQQQQINWLKEMDQHPFSQEEMQALTVKLISELEFRIKGDDEEVDEEITSKITERTQTVLRLFENEERGNFGETKADAWNAWTDYVDHQRTIGKRAGDAIRAQMRRMDDLWSGSGARLKRQAMKLITKA